MSKNMTSEIIDRIFKEPGIEYELTEFEALGKPIREILDIQAKTADTGRDAGKTKYFSKARFLLRQARRKFRSMWRAVSPRPRRSSASYGCTS